MFVITMAIHCLEQNFPALVRQCVPVEVVAEAVPAPQTATMAMPARLMFAMVPASASTRRSHHVAAEAAQEEVAVQEEAVVQEEVAVQEEGAVREGAAAAQAVEAAAPAGAAVVQEEGAVREEVVVQVVVEAVREVEVVRVAEEAVTGAAELVPAAVLQAVCVNILAAEVDRLRSIAVV
ncbi:hypothetical protein A2881_02920 [Candidatus Peribacteria bacterium RIFCSPHIGHO2_01_FULL_55_13]|nr:MAG: hypothetical protein A2881_02920 [Candidatus Peribacteria bacterium RIFCSPHIGHO2_01_FULL_55_13]OGJ65146.1 MAG: hypothetical protein A3F36_02370 [Candidatus Peribacteria bacterium RIFCSPHIGHO2_12_FULL_55_11]